MKTILLYSDFIPLNEEEFKQRAKDNSNGEEYNIRKSLDVISKIPLIHQTTSERALKILESGYVTSYSDLKKSNSKLISDDIKNNTDELDRILGFDNYGFFSYGRIAPPDDVDDLVYLCFDPLKVGDTSGTVIAEKEICEFGAIVSVVGANYHMKIDGLSIEQIQSDNVKAIEDFYNSIIIWQTFEKIFPGFLGQYTNQILEYLTDITYPGEKILKGKIGEVLNYWQGFQFMVPSRVSTNNLTGIMCGENTRYKKIKKLVGKKGVRVIKSEEIRNTIKQSIGKTLGQKNAILMNLFLYLLHNNKIKSRNIEKELKKLGLIR